MIAEARPLQFIYPEGVTPPDIAREIDRRAALSLLRRRWEELFLEHFPVATFPRTFFDHWLYSQLSTTDPTTTDPILRRPDLMREQTLVQFLKDAVPQSTKIARKWQQDIGKVRKTVHFYCLSAQKLLKGGADWIRISTDFDVGDDILDMDEMTRDNAVDAETLLEAFHHFCETFQGHIAARVHVKMASLFQQMELATMECVETLAASQARDDAELSVEKTQETVIFTCGAHRETITTRHFTKLVALLQAQQTQALDPVQSNIAIFCMLVRYGTLFGDDAVSANMHAALPARHFQLLNINLGVAHECFASPLNCYFPRFNSAFHDTDAPFGSQGTFFEFRPKTGSYEVGPPYVEHVVDRVFGHVEVLLLATELPLSFVVFTADWADRAIDVLTSVHLVHNVSVPVNACNYVVGLQHKGHMEFLTPFPTRIYLLQNAAGRAKWQFDLDDLLHQMVKLTS